MLQAQVFIDLEEMKGDQSLHDYIMKFLVEEGISGATSFRGYAGFGKNHRVKFPREMFSFDEPPAMILFIDEDEKVMAAVHKLQSFLPGKLIAVFPVLKA